MADHTINVKLNSTGISKLVRAVADLRKSIDNLTSAFDPLLSKLDSVAKKFQDIANVVRDIKGVRATSSRGSSSNSSGNNSQSNKSSMQDRIEGNVGIMSNRNKVYEERFRKAEERKAKEDKRKADREAAAAKKAQEAADRAEHNKKNPHQHLFQGAFGYRRQSILDTLQGKFNKMPAGKQESIAKLVNLFKVLRGFALLAAVIAGVIYAVVKFASALREAAQSFNLQKEQSNNNTNLYGRGKALSGALGVDAVGDAGKWAGGPKVFWAMLDQLKAIKNDEGAQMYANEVGLSAYLGVRSMSDSSYNDIKKTNEVDPMSSGTAQLAKGVVDSFLDDVRYIWDNVKVALLEILAIFVFIIGAITKPLRWILELLGANDKPADKLGKAADKLDKSAVLLLKGAGAYGGAERLRNAVPASVVMGEGNLSNNPAVFKKIMAGLNAL